VKIEPYAVLIIPISELSNDLLTKQYRVPPGFIATSPYRNERSFAFHRKQGFEGRGRFQADQFAGLDDYESLLMVKDVWMD